MVRRMKVAGDNPAPIKIPYENYLGAILGGRFHVRRFIRHTNHADIYSVSDYDTPDCIYEARAYNLRHLDPKLLASRKRHMNRLDQSVAYKIDQGGRKFLIYMPREERERPHQRAKPVEKQDFLIPGIVDAAVQTDTDFPSLVSSNSPAWDGTVDRGNGDRLCATHIAHHPEAVKPASTGQLDDWSESSKHAWIRMVVKAMNSVATSTNVALFPACVQWRTTSPDQTFMCPPRRTVCPETHLEDCLRENRLALHNILCSESRLKHPITDKLNAAFRNWDLVDYRYRMVIQSAPTIDSDLETDECFRHILVSLNQFKALEDMRLAKWRELSALVQQLVPASLLSELHVEDIRGRNVSYREALVLGMSSMHRIRGDEDEGSEPVILEMQTMRESKRRRPRRRRRAGPG